MIDQGVYAGVLFEHYPRRVATNLPVVLLALLCLVIAAPRRTTPLCGNPLRQLSRSGVER